MVSHLDDQRAAQDYSEGKAQGKRELTFCVEGLLSCLCIQVRMYPGGAYALPSSLASIINLIPYGKDRAAELCGRKSILPCTASQLGATPARGARIVSIVWIANFRELAFRTQLMRRTQERWLRRTD